ncbi:MAG: TonB-dependent receptor [Alphaproteobacteria bacterium]|nr:TonB-dependent receptor [Alphaproteobacteria bacterium]
MQLAAALTLAAAHGVAWAQDEDDEPAPKMTQVVVTAQRLDVARATVQPSLGASTYTVTNDTVENRPGGETTSLDQILLQMPGVTEDGFGRLKVRGDGNLEYRINNVILPEGLTDLGDLISTRVAASVDLITGTLPAQYGLHVGGIVNITTKSGAYLEGGEAELYGGSQSEIEPAFEYGGTAGGTDFFATGEYLGSNLGVASPDSSANPLHDRTDQLQGFAYADRVLDSQDRVSVILAAVTQRFQIPNARGLNAASGAFVPPLTVNGVTSFPSDALDDDQHQGAQFAVMSFQHTGGRLTLQLSGFARYGSLVFHPNPAGNLLFYGISQRTAQYDTGGGLQGDAVYTLNERHTLRAGFFVNASRTSSTLSAAVLPVDASGLQTSQVPLTRSARLVDDETQASLYLQDEWKPVAPLTVNLGMRFDHAGAGNRFSPRLNTVWISGGTTVHAGYARYFIPAPQDLATLPAAALAGTTGALPGGAPGALRPETDDAYDLGMQQKFDDFTFGVDGYWRQAHDLISYGKFGPAILSTPFNYAAGRIRGVEFSLNYAAGPLSAWTNLSLARAEGRQIVSNQSYFTPAELAATSAHFVRLDQDQTATVSAGVSYRWHALLVTGDLLYGSGFRRTLTVPNDASLAAHTVVNFSGVYQLFRHSRNRLDLRLDLINLFDTRYAIQDGTSLASRTPQWGLRRAIFAGIEQSF